VMMLLPDNRRKVIGNFSVPILHDQHQLRLTIPNHQANLHLHLLYHRRPRIKIGGIEIFVIHHRGQNEVIKIVHQAIVTKTVVILVIIVIIAQVPHHLLTKIVEIETVVILVTHHHRHHHVVRLMTHVIHHQVALLQMIVIHVIDMVLLHHHPRLHIGRDQALDQLLHPEEVATQVAGVVAKQMIDQQ
jgi:hypothetical protein